ncbi:phosphoribosyltransferase [Rhizobium sp. KAs_5_22]|uniref:phosphoribosyltransferase n=1 Tax=Ciceribacter selenitireducens TaxID=448181 RepID=UPI00048A89CB|nr:phosphoribosyltransferase [Ciceribacter selenitireducens]PPJ44994.1 phosphoribosyltransferase [Rhizobium sp. KAs_5_22]
MQPHDYWQTIEPPGRFDPAGPHRQSYPASLPDGGQMLLPIRPLADGQHGIASLIVNQASFAVLDTLACCLADRLAEYRPDVIVGLPTLGLTLASAVAQKLGHTRYVPFGTSRKFWYLDELSVPMSSITTPHQQKRLFADPRMLPLLQGRRVVLVDDVMSSGASMVAGLNLLAALDIEPVALAVAMLQTERWRPAISACGEGWPERTRSVIATPLLERNSEGLWKATA